MRRRPTTADPRYTPSTTRREARTLDSQARYGRWQTAYRALKQRRPQISDVWYARQIAKQAVAAGCHASTIRKHMTGDGRGPSPGAADATGHGDGTTVVEPPLRRVGQASPPGDPHHINPLLCPSCSDAYFEAVATAKRSAVHLRLDGPFGCGSLVHQGPVDNADKRFRLLWDVL